MPLSETIVAIASPTSQAARGVVRISGPDCVSLLDRMGIRVAETQRPSRLDAWVDLGSPLGSVPLAVLLWPTARSYTGQPSAELHTLGSLPLLSSLVNLCVTCGGRSARPGEFTMRAFLAGRLDLTQAEAVLGVIEAKGQTALDDALGQLAGNLSQPLVAIRSELLDLLADVEAGLDFVDEDIQFITDETLVERLQDLLSRITAASDQIRSRGGGSVTTSIALRGDPNAGKSRLMNALIGEEVAIVADVAGTTRDVVTAPTSISGHPVTLKDTAGIEAGDSLISEASQRMGTEVARQSTIRLWCVDAHRDDFQQAAAEVVKAVSQRSDTQTGVDLLLATKCDLSTAEAIPDPWIQCSAVTSDGLDDIRSAIVRVIVQNDAEETGASMGTAARCTESFNRSKEAVSKAIALTLSQSGHEFVSAELRLATQCIGEVTGEIYNEDILDRVFSRFCIGK